MATRCARQRIRFRREQHRAEPLYRTLHPRPTRASAEVDRDDPNQGRVLAAGRRAGDSHVADRVRRADCVCGGKCDLAQLVVT